MIRGINDSYSNFLLRRNSVSIHHRHLEFLVTEKFKNISNQSRIHVVLLQAENFILKRPILNLPRTQSTNYCTNAVHFRGSFVWDNVPEKIDSAIRVSNLKPKFWELWQIFIVDV